MPVVLRVKVGSGFLDASVLKPGKPQTIGRLDHSDLAFPDDVEMSGQHLSISLNPDNSCSYSDLGSTNGSFVNEIPVSNGILLPGDILRCGVTEFCIHHADEKNSAEPVKAHSHVHPAPRPVPAAVPGAGKMEAARTQPSMAENSSAVVLPEISGFTGDTAQEIFEKYALGKEISQVPNPGESPEKYARRLCAASEDNACLTFLAFALPKRCAVWWLTQCTLAAESFKSEADRPMLALAENWVRLPSEENRRKAMTMAEELEMASPAAWAGVAAFWSHGSLGPPEAPPVPAAEPISGKAVKVGALMASVLHAPQNAPERRRQFTELGIRIASGQMPWS